MKYITTEGFAYLIDYTAELEFNKPFHKRIVVIAGDLEDAIEAAKEMIEDRSELLTINKVELLDDEIVIIEKGIYEFLEDEFNNK